MYKILDNETILNIVVGPSLDYIFYNFDIIAAKAIYIDVANSTIIIGVLDRTNHGLSLFLITNN